MLSHIPYSLCFVYLLIAAVIGLALYLFVTLKREIHHIDRQSRQFKEVLDALVLELHTERQRMSSTLTRLEQQPELLAPPPQLVSGLNFSRRSQVLRLLRGGESNEQIASTLRLPRAEVKLLRKVHELIVSAAS